MKAIVRIMILLLTASFLTAGCAAATGKPEKKPQQQQEAVQVEPAMAERVRETANRVDGVEDSTAAVVNKEISVAVKVGGFDRLRLKQLKEEIFQEVKKTAPAYGVNVTADKKLFSELRKLEVKIANNPQGNALTEIKTKIDKINDDMQG